jgi:hypothetical protein
MKHHRRLASVGSTVDEETATASMTAIRLSKSRLMSGLQCPKRLWLEIHEPWRAQIDAGARKPVSPPVIAWAKSREASIRRAG